MDERLKELFRFTERALRHSPMETASIAEAGPPSALPRWEPYANWIFGVRLIDGQRSFSPVMKRVNESGKTEYRHMTSAEACDYLASLTTDSRKS